METQKNKIHLKALINVVNSYIQLIFNKTYIHYRISLTEGHFFHPEADECDSDSCSGHGTCHEIVGPGVICHCDTMYTGVDCSQKIEVFCRYDPCKVNSVRCDDPNKKCVCQTGWEGQYCDKGLFANVLCCLLKRSNQYCSLSKRPLWYRQYIELMTKESGMVKWLRVEACDREMRV